MTTIHQPKTVKYSDHELSKFLNLHKCNTNSDGSLATMTCMGRGGKWIISDEDYPKFLDLLHDYLFVNRGHCMNYVEQPRKDQPKPLLIDLDFRYSADTSLTRAFGVSNIESFIHKIVDGLNEFFYLDQYELLRFFVTLRPAPYKDKAQQKDGVHILCPDIALSNEKQAVLRKWLLNHNAVGECFVGTDYTNTDENVYDESMTRKQGWIFFGESKPNIPAYQLDSVFAYNPVDTEWVNEDTSQYSSRNLIEILSVRFNILEDNNDVRDEAVDLYKSLVTTAPVPAETTHTATTTDGENAIIDAINYLYGGRSLEEQEFIMIRRFVLECLKESWWEEYDKWIRVGWCLNNISQTDEMLALYKEFSDKSGKASNTDWEKIRRNWFHGMGKTGDGPRLTERSLRKWARDDNPELYNSIIKGNISEYILAEVEGSHYHIASLMKKMYGNTYVASVNPKSTEWYKYDDDINMWKKINQGIELRTKISVDVALEVNATVGMVLAKRGDPKTPNERKEWFEKKFKDLVKVQTQLYSNGFTESVMKMATQQFCEEEFMNKLNIDPFLFGCRNGVLELRAKDAGKERVIFRQGRPEDYISFLAGRNYPDSEPINYVPYNPKDPMQIEIADFFSKLFPRKDLCAYVLRLLASCLEGANREQCYYTFTGAGGNGKSKLIELMRLTFGDYQTSMSSTVLTRSRPQAGAANPELMVTKCRRFIYMQEPDEKEPINTSIMKQFSGEDIIEARQLYGEQDKFRIMGKICMMCNTLPPVTSMDEGTWRRIRVVPFESTFLPPDHPGLLLKKPNNFPRDPKLDEKLRLWREPFLSLLVHIYDTEYIKSGLNPVPEIVLQASNKYKENFDVIAKFDGDRIREPKTDADRLNCRTSPVDTNFIKNAFKIWKNEQQIKFKDDNQLISRLSAKYGDPERGKYWTGIFVFDNDQTVTEWDEEHASI